MNNLRMTLTKSQNLISIFIFSITFLISNSPSLALNPTIEIFVQNTINFEALKNQGKLIGSKVDLPESFFEPVKNKTQAPSNTTSPTPSPGPAPNQPGGFEISPSEISHQSTPSSQSQQYPPYSLTLSSLQTPLFFPASAQHSEEDITIALHIKNRKSRHIFGCFFNAEGLGNKAFFGDGESGALDPTKDLFVDSSRGQGLFFKVRNCIGGDQQEIMELEDYLVYKKPKKMSQCVALV